MFWIDITAGADEADVKKAKSAAEVSRKGKLPALEFTEANYKWIMLYDHARKGQINPSKLKLMRRSDLEYLAGMTLPHPDLVEAKRKDESDLSAEQRHEEVTKLLGNVARAKTELERRNLIWTIGFALIAALVSGTAVAFIGAWIN